MKRVIIVVCCMLFSLAVYAKPSNITLKMLKDTSVAEGKESLASHKK